MGGKRALVLIAAVAGIAAAVCWAVLVATSRTADAPGGGVGPDRSPQDSASYWTDERIRSAEPM